MNNTIQNHEREKRIVTIHGVSVQLEFAPEANKEIVSAVRQLLKSAYMQKVCS